jgi:glucose/arabinose dehydrogenase
MRSLRLVFGLFFLALTGPATHAAEPEVKPTDSRPSSRPYGIDKRIPWTTSRVIGSPEPPLPYRVTKAFPKLKLVCPIAVAHEPDTDRLLLIHQHAAWTGAGRIVRIKDDPEVQDYEVFLDVDGIAYGLAFHPNFAKNGYLYVGSNGPITGKKTTRIIRYTIERQAPHKIVPGSEVKIIEWESDGHNGGDLAFGNDGMLYVSSGDGTSDSDTNLSGQDLSKLLAKVLRIDVDHPDSGKQYSVPAGNPFVGRENVRPETWAYGFRNPWRLHIDRKSGDLWIGNNGQDLWEQAYLVERGANYGWSVMEGSHDFYPQRRRGPTPFSRPIVEHPHSEMRSLTGGVVYHGKELPELEGAYLYGDWSTGKIWGVRHERGKVIWHRQLASTTLQITGFGYDSKGELLIADHGGGFFRLEPSPKEANPSKFPRRLSETGLFQLVKGHVPDPALIPYSVNAPLWSDGAEKERYLALPGNTTIEFTRSHGWNFEDGTVLVKTFSLDMEAGNSASRRRIETRLLTRQKGQWAGYSYLWNDEQTDAELVEGAGLDRVYDIRDRKTTNGVRKQTWHYPSRVECMVCHSRAANWVLGLTEVQMNKVHDYGAVKDNQLRTLEHLGVFKVPETEHVKENRAPVERAFALAEQVFQGPHKSQEAVIHALSPEMQAVLAVMPNPVATRWQVINRLAFAPFDKLEARLNKDQRTSPRLPRRPDEYRRLVNPYDARADLDQRARSYLHANCAQCHVLAGGGNAAIELEFTTPRNKMLLFDVKPNHHTFDIPDARLVAPGKPERSVLLERVLRRGPGQMPPLATSVVDEEGVKLLREWISKMPAN